MTATYTFDIFSSIDGFGSYAPPGDWGGYWGKQGPQLLEHRLATYDGEQRMVFGANTYRAFAKMLAATSEGDEVRDLWVDRMRSLPTYVVSSTLEDPLDWRDATVVSGDPVETVARLKEESDVPLRSHGSLILNRALMAAGLVDRVQLTLYPVITGQTGDEPIFAGAADFDLELLESRTLDSDITELVYRPTLRTWGVGARVARGQPCALTLEGAQVPPDLCRPMGHRLDHRNHRRRGRHQPFGVRRYAVARRRAAGGRAGTADLGRVVLHSRGAKRSGSGLLLRAVGGLGADPWRPVHGRPPSLGDSATDRCGTASFPRGGDDGRRLHHPGRDYLIFSEPLEASMDPFEVGHLEKPVSAQREPQQKVRLNLGGSVYDPTDPVGRLLFNVLAMVAEFESDLIRLRTREGMKVAKAKGRLRGKQPKLNQRQEAHLVALLKSGDHSTAELADLFGVARSTVYRAMDRERTRNVTGAGTKVG